MTPEERESNKAYYRLQFRAYYYRNLEKCRERARDNARRRRERIGREAVNAYIRAWRAKLAALENDN